MGALDLTTLTGPLLAILSGWMLLTFSSLAEAALMRMELGRARQLAEERGRSGRRLLRLVEHRQEVLGSLILLINLAIITTSAFTTEVALRLSGEDHRVVAFASAAMVVFLLLFCELTPKTYGLRRAEPVAFALAPFIGLAHTALGPLTRALHRLSIWIISRAIVPLVGGQVLAGLPQYTDEEVLELVAEGEERGGIEEDEREMIAGVIEFADKVTREVMTPRTDIVWLEEQASLIEAARVSAGTGYSRLPVCAGDIDHVTGILYLKDVVAPLTEGAAMTAGAVARKPPPLVPESKQVHEVLHLMQRQRLHMVVVIDEYGGTAGLVTIEDLLEEIFGEIRDEHDVETEPITILDEQTTLVDARLSVADFEDHYEISLPEGDFDSIGGFVLDQLGHLPETGEQVWWEEFEVIVEEVSENRIRRLRVIRQRNRTRQEEALDG